MSDVAALPKIIYDVIQQQRAQHPDRPVLIGVSGAQGSGKTTAVELLEAANRPRFANFSIDDVYLDHTQRAELAARTHPLFVTRGPPGTHDLALARRTFEALTRAEPGTETPLPRFDKIKDVMKPREQWPLFRGRPEAILFDAWCLGALPPAPSPPLNEIEAQDRDGVWRELQGEFLRTTYAEFFALFDAIIYVQAPNWEVVPLRGRALTPDEVAWIDRFVMHYERITRSMIGGNRGASLVVKVDEARRVITPLT